MPTHTHAMFILNVNFMYNCFTVKLIFYFYFLQEECSLAHLSLASNGLTDSSITVLSRFAFSSGHFSWKTCFSSSVSFCSCLLFKKYIYIFAQVPAFVFDAGESEPVRKPVCDLSRTPVHPDISQRSFPITDAFKPSGCVRFSNQGYIVFIR